MHVNPARRVKLSTRSLLRTASSLCYTSSTTSTSNLNFFGSVDRRLGRKNAIVNVQSSSQGASNNLEPFFHRQHFSKYTDDGFISGVNLGRYESTWSCPIHLQCNTAHLLRICTQTILWLYISTRSLSLLRTRRLQAEILHWPPLSS